MDGDIRLNNSFDAPRLKPTPNLQAPKELITVLTVLVVLMKMRRYLGLEVMLEFIEKYLLLVSQKNSHVYKAVDKRLGLDEIKRMFSGLNA
jgi:hypothetical protein